MIKWIFLLQCTIAASYFIYGQEAIHTLYFENPNPHHLESSISFPKDIQAIIHFGESLNVDMSVLKGAWDTNLKVRPEKDWENLKGRAVTDSSES